MAKLAVLLFATLVIHAALAERRDKHHKHESTYDVERFDWKQGNDLDQYLMQLRVISKDVTDRLRDITQHEQPYTKNLNWHCHVLYKYFDSIIERLEKDLSYGKGTDNVVLQKFFHELRDIQMTLSEVEGLSFEQLKNTLDMCIRKFVVQVEEPVRYVDKHLTQGTLNYTIKYVLVDFITIIQNIDYQLKNFVHKEYTLMQLATEIRELTRDLTKYLEDTSFNTVHVKQTLRQYLYHLNFLKNQHILDTVVVDNELIVLFDQMYKKLYDVIVPLTETTKYDRFVNIDLLKREFIKELDIVCERINKYVELYETKYQGTERYWIIEKILKNYLFTIYQFKTDLLKDVKVDYYNKDIYNLWGKTDVKKSVFGVDTYYKKDDVYNQRTGHGLTVQVYGVVEDLINYLETLHLDNVVVKQTLKQLIRVYITNLETIVNKLEELYTYKQYNVGTEMREIIHNLRQYIVSLKVILTEEQSFNTYELKHHIKIYLNKFTTDLEKLTVLWQTKFDETSEAYLVLRNVIVKFLTYTRNFNMYLHNIGQVSYTGKNYFDFGSQIQILARDFIINLKSLSMGNNMLREVILTRIHDYTHFVQTVVELLESKLEYNTVYHDEVYQKVIVNLRQIVDVLEQVVKHEDVSIDKLRNVLVICIENTVGEMKNLLWIWQKYGHEQELQTVLYRMFYNYMVSLKQHHYQVNQVYYNNELGQDMHTLSSQIDITTNNLVNYIRNVNVYNSGHKEIVLDVIKRDLIHCLQLLIVRLETELSHNDVSGVHWEIISELKHVIDNLRDIDQYRTLRTGFNMQTELHYVLIRISKIFQRLSYTVESDMKVHENIEHVVRSVLMHYLVCIQHLQVDFHRAHYYNHIASTPSEIVLKIEVICNRLQELLRFSVPVTTGKDLGHLVYIRDLYNALGHIVDFLQESKQGYNQEYNVGVIDQFRKMRVYFEKYIFNVDHIETEELHVHLRYAVDEIKKIFWVFQYGFQHDVEKYDDEVKTILHHFVLDLEYFEYFLQERYQLISGVFTSEELFHQIEIVTGRLNNIFQYGWSNTGKFRQVLVLQVKQFVDSIKNLSQMLKYENVFTVARQDLTNEVSTKLMEIYLRLDEVTTIDNEITTQELAKVFYLAIRDTTVALQKLEYGFTQNTEDYEIKFTRSIIRSGIRHYLIGLRNLYIQLDNTKQFGMYHENKDLFNQIQIVFNHLTNTLEYMDWEGVELKDYFIIHSLIYNHRIHLITDKLEYALKYGKVHNVELEKIIFNLRKVVVNLMQIGTTIEKETALSAYSTFFTSNLQCVHIELQKLMLLKDLDIDNVIRGIFVDYYTTLESLIHRVDEIKTFMTTRTSIEEIFRYIDVVVYDISYLTRHLTFTDTIVEKTFMVEFRKWYKFVDTIVDRLYTFGGAYQKYAEDLKNVQLFARKYITETYTDVYQQRIQLDVYLRRVHHIVKQLVWTVRCEYKEFSMIPTELKALLKTLLEEFMIVGHKTEIHFLNVLELPYVRQYGLEWTRNRDQTFKVLNYDDKIYSGYEVRQDKYRTITEIKKYVFDLIKILRDDRDDVTVTRKDVLVYTTEIRKMIHIVDNIVQRLKLQVRNFEGDAKVLNKLIDRLENCVMSLKRVIEYTTFTGIVQLRKEFIQFLYVVVEQFDRLVMIDQEYRGRLDIDLTKVFEEFLVVLRKLNVLCRYGYENDSTYRYSGDYKYGRKYGYDYDTTYNMKPLTRNTDRKDYGYGKLYDFYYKPHEIVNKKFDHGLKNDWFEREGEYTIEELIEKTKLCTSKVIKGIVMIVRDTDSKDVLVYQIRKLMNILDIFIYKFEEVIKTYKHNEVYQIYENIKDMRRELYQVVHSDAITTVYQIKTQFTVTIQNIYDNLVRLVRTVQDKSLVYDIVYQYYVYLHNVHLQWEKNINNVEGLTYRYRDFDTQTRGYTGRVLNTYQLREFTVTLRHIIDKVQSKIYLIKDKEVVVLRQVLVKLEEILREVSGNYVSNIEYNHLHEIVHDVVYELKNAMTVFEQYGRDYDLYIWCKDILQEFTYPVEKLFY